MDLRQVVFYDHRNAIFIPLITITSALAVRPDSTTIPLIVTLSVLLTYSPFLFRRDNKKRILYIALTLIGLTLGSSFSRMQASLKALSTPGSSLASLFTLSFLLSSIALGIIQVSNKLQSYFDSSWSQLIFFPAVWTTTWYTIAHTNPFGYLATWSVASNEDVYKWMVSIFGPASKDWVVAAWAVVISQLAGKWYIGFKEKDDDESTSLLHPRNTVDKNLDNTNVAAGLGFLLTLLVIPSFLFPTWPLPVTWSSVDISTPLTVGCVLPSYNHPQNHVPTLDDYINESKTIRALTRIVLWPEGAVTFHSAEEKEKAFDRIRFAMNGTYVGVSFEEVLSDPTDPTGQRSITMTGMAVISDKSKEPHHIYYKRHLVPVAESFRLRHSSAPSTLSQIELPRPTKKVDKETWGGDTRPLFISSSICLDFAHPSTFSDLPSRPSLILAPARTWDRSVGHAMWLQAKQRAEELNSVVLWCDGGEGGVSGVAGGGYNEINQVGMGTFIRTIGIEYPLNGDKSYFARFGTWVLMMLWLLVFIPESHRQGRYNVMNLRRGIHSISRFIPNYGSARNQPRPQPNLIDLP